MLTDKQVRFDDGQVWHADRMERPVILFDDQGNPMFLFVACKKGGGTYNLALPLIPNPKRNHPDGAKRSGSALSGRTVLWVPIPRALPWATKSGPFRAGVAACGLAKNGM